MHRLLFSSMMMLYLPLWAVADTPEPLLALKGLDPIALAQGQETPGLANLETAHGLFRYRFATAENKARFDANPVELGIQFGGACGKMGPFSSNGSPDRFHVHNNRIYVFASESCRDAFKKNPDKHIELPNPIPTGTADEQKQGAALLARALEGFGGASKVDHLTTYTSNTKVVYQQNGKDFVGHHRIAWVFPDRYRFEENWGTAYGQTVDGKNSFQFSGKKAWTLDDSVVAIARRQALRDPLAMLRLRQTPGFVAIARGTGKVDETPVELLEVALQGATSTWSIDPKTGRILMATYQARRGMVSDIMVKYSDFREIDGLTVPFGRADFVNGKALTSPKIAIEQISLNQKQDPQWFQRPEYRHNWDNFKFEP